MTNRQQAARRAKALNNLKAEERAEYKRLTRRDGAYVYARNQALRAIGRGDLVK